MGKIIPIKELQKRRKKKKEDIKALEKKVGEDITHFAKLAHELAEMTSKAIGEIQDKQEPMGRRTPKPKKKP